MIIIRPTTITSAMITANTATNADADYVATTPYAAGVKVTYNNNIYLSSQASNLGHTPGDAGSTAWWSLVTTANKWAAFDPEVTTQTLMANSWSFTLNVDLIDALAVMNLSNCAQIVVTLSKGGSQVYSKTVGLLDTTVVETWKDYFQSTPEFLDAVSFTDIPKIPASVLTVTVTNTGNTVGVGKVVIGEMLGGGMEDYGLARSGTDFTSATFDKFGTLSLDKQKYVRDFSTLAKIPISRFDSISKRLDSIASVPVVCIGGNGFFSTLIIYGLLSYSTVIPRFGQFEVKYELKGL